MVPPQGELPLAVDVGSDVSAGHRLWVALGGPAALAHPELEGIEYVRAAVRQEPSTTNGAQTGCWVLRKDAPIMCSGYLDEGKGCYRDLRHEGNIVTGAYRLEFDDGCRAVAILDARYRHTWTEPPEVIVNGGTFPMTLTASAEGSLTGGCPHLVKKPYGAGTALYCNLFFVLPEPWQDRLVGRATADIRPNPDARPTDVLELVIPRVEEHQLIYDPWLSFSVRCSSYAGTYEKGFIYEFHPGPVPSSGAASAEEGAAPSADSTEEGAAPSATPSQTAPQEPVLLFSSENSDAVLNGPTRPTTFTLTGRCRVTEIRTYHWNDGRGAPPGQISLSDPSGRRLGTWQAAGLPAANGAVPNAFWICRPDLEIPARTYLVTDSDPATWSTNATAGNAGMVSVTGIPLQ